ncbi:MAG: SdrD B-like domain-containing protein, partial [Anaerolineae bacterium]
QAGEAGINGVQVKLYRDNGDGLFTPATDTVIGTQTTRSGGKYIFQNLAPADYFVDVIDATVPNGYVITTHNDPTPMISLGDSESYLEADFGYTTPFGDLQISKTLTSADPAYLGQQIDFTIRITNTGTTIINKLPLSDWYDTGVLDFVSATPATDNNVDDGALNWSDLTVSFGHDLSPGQSFQIVVHFLAMQATSMDAPMSAPEALGTTAVNGPQSDPLVDGLLDSSYSYTSHIMTSDSSSGGNLYSYAGSTMCYWSFVMDRKFNSNVYADSGLDNAYMLQDGWSTGHDFSKLLNSDQATVKITYSGGSYNTVGLDLLYGTTGNWTSGQTGHDNSPNPGTAPINDAMTSLHWNLENSNWTGSAWGGQLKHSPPFNYNATSGNYWEWNLIYEFSVPKSAMNGACGAITLVSAHNSPSKDSSNLATIGDRVWHDLDGDGVQDANEPGLPGVTVNLYQGATLVRTTITEPGTTGYYLFNNLSAGTYTVNVDETTLTAGFVLTTNNEPLTVVLASGQDYLTADFGYWQAGTASIGDRVFYDLNGDGLPDNDSDPGINGVTVKLYQGACPASGSPKKTLVTSGNGDYDFTQLLAGTYCVDVDESTLPAGWNLTTANEPLTVVLATSQDYNNADFGYRTQCTDATPNLAIASGVIDDTNTTLPDQRAKACAAILPALGAIGDFVWYDSDQDGIEDVGEPGIPNVTVALYRDTDGSGTLTAGDTLMTTTTTDADGGYIFKGLPTATYFVDVTDTNNVLTGLTHIVANQSKPDPTAAIVLGTGQVYKDADFGYVQQPTSGKAIIGDTVWYDDNGDGIQQPNEPGIPGIQVCATPVGGGAAICDTTDG